MEAVFLTYPSINMYSLLPRASLGFEEMLRAFPLALASAQAEALSRCNAIADDKAGASATVAVVGDANTKGEVSVAEVSAT